MGNSLVFRTVPEITAAILALALLLVAFWMVFVTIFLLRHKGKAKRMIASRILYIRPELDIYHHSDARRTRPQ